MKKQKDEPIARTRNREWALAKAKKIYEALQTRHEAEDVRIQIVDWHSNGDGDCQNASTGEYRTVWSTDGGNVTGLMAMLRILAYPETAQEPRSRPAPDFDSPPAAGEGAEK